VAGLFHERALAGLDLDGAGRFTREVASMLEEPVAIIEVDATELTFTDSAGLIRFSGPRKQRPRAARP
jgi:hypothetical protein